MIVEEYEYMGYKVEISEHPVYHDYEYVVKENNKIKFTNEKFYKSINDIHQIVKLEIDSVIK